MSLSFDPKKGLIIVPTRLYGPSGDIVVRLALDTGATGSMINWDIIVLLGYDPAAISDRIQMITGSGIEFVPQVNLHKIEALGIIRSDYLILCHTLPQIRVRAAKHEPDMFYVNKNMKVIEDEFFS